MKAAMISRLAATCFVVLLPAALATADDGGSAADEGGSVSLAADGRSGAEDADRDGDADGDADQNQARELVEHGIIRPLREVLEHVRTAAPGEVVGIAFAHRAGRWIYGLQVLTPAGRGVELKVDAGTLAILPGRR